MLYDKCLFLNEGLLEYLGNKSTKYSYKNLFEKKLYINDRKKIGTNEKYILKVKDSYLNKMNNEKDMLNFLKLFTDLLGNNFDISGRLNSDIIKNDNYKKNILNFYKIENPDMPTFFLIICCFYDSKNKNEDNVIFEIYFDVKEKFFDNIK